MKKQCLWLFIVTFMRYVFSTYLNIYLVLHKTEELIWIYISNHMMNGSHDILGGTLRSPTPPPSRILIQSDQDDGGGGWGIYIMVLRRNMAGNWFGQGCLDSRI